MIHWIYDTKYERAHPIQFKTTNILEVIHIFSILDFENYYKNWFLFLFSILIKLFDHEIVNCEIIHDVSMLIYILTTENVKNSNNIRKISDFFSKLQQKVFQKSSFFEISKGYPLWKKFTLKGTPFALEIPKFKTIGGPFGVIFFQR